MSNILIVEDEVIIRTALRKLLTRNKHDVKEAGSVNEATSKHKLDTFDLIISDLRLPGAPGTDLIQLAGDVPVLIMTSYASLRSAVDSMRMGAVDYIAKPFDHDEMLAAVKRVIGKAKAAIMSQPQGAIVENNTAVEGMIGSSTVMKALYAKIHKVAPTNATVLINGETGTGKELVAKALHDYGKRRHGPFVAINMAAIPRELIESELFGHEKGAFTGASQRSTGRFQQAEGGTLFLDEIGDMPMEAQTRLLRVLQEGEYTTVGGRTPIKTDVRIVAATNRDLRQLINQGLFREDLFYRLNVVPIRLPPLRERTEDIPDLVRHFLTLAQEEGLPHKMVDADGMDFLKRYRWPGNVRELENLVRRLAALYTEDTIGLSVLQAELTEPEFGPVSEPADIDDGLADLVERALAREFASHGDQLPPEGLYERVLKEIEKPLFTISLAATRGNQIKAAQLLGINRNTLRKKIRELDVQVVRLPR